MLSVLNSCCRAWSRVASLVIVSLMAVLGAASPDPGVPARLALLDLVRRYPPPGNPGELQRFVADSRYSEAPGGYADVIAGWGPSVDGSAAEVASLQQFLLAGRPVDGDGATGISAAEHETMRAVARHRLRELYCTLGVWEDAGHAAASWAAAIDWASAAADPFTTLDLDQQCAWREVLVFLDPGNAPVWRDLGILYHRLNDYLHLPEPAARAVHCLRQSALLDPSPHAASSYWSDLVGSLGAQLQPDGPWQVFGPLSASVAARFAGSGCLGTDTDPSLWAGERLATAAFQPPAHEWDNLDLCGALPKPNGDHSWLLLVRDYVASTAMSAWVYTAADDNMTLWLNQQRVALPEPKTCMHPRRRVMPMRFRQGRNQLAALVHNIEGVAWLHCWVVPMRDEDSERRQLNELGRAWPPARDRAAWHDFIVDAPLDHHWNWPAMADADLLLARPTPGPVAEIASLQHRLAMRCDGPNVRAVQTFRLRELYRMLGLDEMVRRRLGGRPRARREADLGLRLLRLGRLAEASSHLGVANFIDPADVSTALALAIAWIGIRDAHGADQLVEWRARSLLEDLARRPAPDPEVLYWRAMLEHLCGDPAHCARILHPDGDYARPVTGLAPMLLDAINHDHWGQDAWHREAVEAYRAREQQEREALRRRIVR